MEFDIRVILLNELVKIRKILKRLESPGNMSRPHQLFEFFVPIDLFTTANKH